VIQHWDVADDKYKAKAELRTGKVDVLTLSPIFLPDDGIEKFTTLALEHNPDIRICIQPIWLRWDVYELTTKRPEKVDHNDVTAEELKKRHAAYFKSMDDYVADRNKKLGKTVLYIVPAPQAVIALREKIIDGKGAGAQVAGRPIHGPTGARHGAAQSTGGVLQLRGDLSAPARSACPCRRY